MKPEGSSTNGHVEAGISKGGSGIGPVAQQVVIDAGELHAGGMVGNVVAYALNGHVQIEEQSAFGVFVLASLEESNVKACPDINSVGDLMQAAAEFVLKRVIEEDREAFRDRPYEGCILQANG
jgi:hypothetical protein